MRHVNRLTVAASALAFAMVGIAAPAPAQAAPSGSVLAGVAVPGGFGSWAELLTIQERMNAAGARITALGRADAGSGYSGIVADPTARELRVYWKGRAPASLTALASTAAVPVKVLPAAYTERELRLATKRLLARAGADLTAVGPRADGSGLLAGTAGEAIPASSYAGVPVTLDTNLTVQPSTRVNDAPPWSGGARWVNVTRGGSSCSTGFGIRQAGVNRLLTAAHCGATGHTANDGAGQLIGSYGTDVNGNDVSVLNGPSQARVFNNTTNAAGGVVTEFTNPVVGSQASAVGNFVCSSGSFSGTRCRIQVASINQCINLNAFDGVVLVCGQVRANQIDGTNAGGQGDSGGPVLTTVAGDATRVIARGTVSARPNGLDVPCTGYVTTNRICSSGLFYEDIVPGLAAVGATLLTA